MTKFCPFLFLFLVFGSLILGPLFITYTPQIGFNFISQALAQESSNEESSDSGGDEEKEDEQSEEESDEQSEEESDEQSEEESDEQSEEESDEQSEEESDEQKCIETEETEEETDDQLSEETCDNSETDEESDDQSEEESDKETQETDETDEESDKETQETDETDEESDKETQETDEIQKDEASNSGTEANVPTVLDIILSDDSLLKQVFDDKTIEPGFASALAVIQEEQISIITETCGNEADDDGEGIADENCEESISTLTETCGNEADDDGDGMIDEEECIVPPVEVCDNDIDDDADGKIDDTDEDDCPAIMPTVVIESAEDEEGEPLSQGDMIAPGEVTFTFTAKTGETSVDSQENSQDLEFECALDGKSFSSCNSPETIQMDDGKHTFEVRLAS